ncbi:DUF1651 domain-containing protein [Prochlorococcus marinus]|uniref:DUF1651 domain-containing protein n=1 Tax=Prochlorococcus marinus TaxID=1219 RepID=UPI0022B365FB|nr:DUF1651 domain-containing protein [Prochlorococcus marinus]
MKKVENLEAPIGWLIDPQNKWAIHFDFKELTNENISADFTIDMWGVVQSGKPMTFKSRRKVTKEDSLKTWNQLLSSNWVEFDFDRDKTI